MCPTRQTGEVRVSPEDDLIMEDVQWTEYRARAIAKARLLCVSAMMLQVEKSPASQTTYGTIAPIMPESWQEYANARAGPA